MSLTVRTQYLADLSDLASRCAACFCMARCAGCDVAAIGAPARAAMALGANLEWLYAEARPFDEDRQYLEECEFIRSLIAARAKEIEDLMREAEEQAASARRAMRAAMLSKPPDMAAYAAAEAEYADAVCAWEICEVALDHLSTADQALRWADVRYFQVYEAPVTLVAQGGLLPYDGRWIQGEPQVRVPRNAGNLIAGAQK